MYTLLIADDEYFVLERIKRILDYPSLGYRLIGSCLNGRDALDSIRSLHPDVAILDIRMPYFTGLEIAQTLKEEGLPTKIILLTSYDFFEYAKQAISFNVFAYLLKPLVKEELEASLRQLSGIISKEKEQASTAAKMEEILQTEHMMSVLSGNLPVTDEFVDTDTIYLIKIYNPDNLRQYLDPVTACLKDKDMNSIRKIVSIEENILCITAMTNGNYKKHGEDIQKKLEANIKQPFKMVYTNIGDTSKTIPACYRHALNILSDTLFLPSGGIVNANEKRPDHSHYPVNLSDKLAGAMRTGDTEACKKLIENAFSKLMLPEYACTVNLELLLTQIYSVLNMTRLHHHNYSENSISFSVRETINTQLECTAIKNSCIELVTGQIQLESENAESHNSEKLVNEVISYINDHYHDPELNISQISAHVSYSENHLSNLFRRQTGGSIVQYITKCRMSEAYHLLREGMSVSQAASVTGYTSPYYFSRRFKQYYGFPPSILFE